MELLRFSFPISDVETYLFVPLAVAFAISFFTSMGGISGAFLLLPFQVSVLGFVTPAVSSTNLLFNVVGTPGGVMRYGREKRLVWPIALIIVVGVVPGVLAGYILRLRYLPDPGHFKLFVGIILLCVAAKLMTDCWRKRAISESPGHLCNRQVEGAFVTLSRSGFVYGGNTYSFPTIGFLALAFGVGIVGGIYGIGGGSIIAPVCISVLGLPVHPIAGAVLLGTFASSLSGIVFYSAIPVNGTMASPDWLLGALFGLGGLLGMYCGAKAQKHVNELTIKLGLCSLIGFIAVRYISGFAGN